MGEDKGGNGADQGQSLLEFPGRHEIKAMGRDSNRFEALVQSIIGRHIAADDLLGTQRRPSRNGKYISITCIVMLQTRQQLELIYQDLYDHPDVLATL